MADRNSVYSKAQKQGVALKVLLLCIMAVGALSYFGARIIEREHLDEYPCYKELGMMLFLVPMIPYLLTSRLCRTIKHIEQDH